MKGRLLFLGTGSSFGIPVIGCSCKVCTSVHPANKRLRSSVLLTLQGKQILIDCSPDFREQALRHHIDHLNGLIVTHVHHDHTSGIDELRILSYRSGKPIPCIASKETGEELKERFYYMLAEVKDGHPDPKVELTLLPSDRGTVEFEGISLKYFTYEQAKTKVTGYRIGNLAYITDIHDYPATIFDDLQGVDILILSALRFLPSPIHFSVDEAVDFSLRTGAKETWLTHIAHEMEHEYVNAYLPPSIRAAHDGLEIDFIGGAAAKR